MNIGKITERMGALKEAIDEAIEEAKESSNQAKNSYGAGYDAGYAAGLRHAIITISGCEDERCPQHGTFHDHI